MSSTSIKQKRKERKPGVDGKQYPSGTFLRVEIAIMLALLLIAFGTRYVCMPDMGITYDEPIYVMAGVQYINGIGHLNVSSSLWSYNMEHPPVSKYIYGTAITVLGGQMINWGMIDYRTFSDARLASALMGALTCVLVYMIGRDFLGRKIGITSALLLSFLPVFLANTEIATLESPLAFFFTLTIYLFMVALQRGSRNYFIGAAIACGLTLGTKYNGVFVLPIIALLYVLYAMDSLRKKEGTLSLDVVSRNLGTLFPAKALVAFIAIAGALFFLLWPWSWTDPIGHLSQSLGHWSYSPQEYFLGVLQSAPLYYYPVYFAVTTPVLLFIPLVIGVLALARSRDSFKIALLLWLAIPFLYGFSSFVQNGMRYMITIYPAVALICGYGLWAVAGWIGNRYKEWGKDKVFFVVSAAAVVYVILSSASVYPYFTDYYNVMAGGPQGAYEHRSFNFGWWGEGIKQAMDYVESTATSGSLVLMATDPDDPTNMFMEQGRMNYFYPMMVHMGNSNMTINFTQPMFAYHPVSNNMLYAPVPTTVTPQYVITNYRIREYRNITMDVTNYSLIYQVKVQGAPMVEVYKAKMATKNSSIL